MGARKRKNFHCKLIRLNSITNGRATEQFQESKIESRLSGEQDENSTHFLRLDCDENLGMENSPSSSSQTNFHRVRVVGELDLFSSKLLRKSHAISFLLVENDFRR